MNGAEQLIAAMWGSLLLLIGWVFYIERTYNKDDEDD
jgi:hypothetical protein